MDHRSEFTACESDADCVIRSTACCECAAPRRAVAINVARRADFEALLCAPGMLCPDCVPDYGTLFTWCGGDAPGMPKRCRVDVVGP